MPVTSRSLLVSQVSGAGKKAPVNLRYDPAKQQLINIDCECITIPSPITIEYTTAGTYIDELPSLPSRYNWQISGIIISGGGGGGGGGGGQLIINFISGQGGFASNIISSLPFYYIFPSGASITTTVGAGGIGGNGGGLNSSGSIGLPGGSSSVLYNSINFVSSPSSGGIGGLIFGPSLGQSGGSGPGSGGSGGNGSTSSGSSGSNGLPGADGSVSFTATPILV